MEKQFDAGTDNRSAGTSGPGLSSAKLPPLARLLLHGVMHVMGSRLLAVYGLERVERLARQDKPVIFALRHPKIAETVALACLLMQALELRPISFMIDWMFIYAPFLRRIVAAIKPIAVWRKRARWPWLQKRKPAERPDPLEVAVLRLAEGISTGIFPEGVRNTEHSTLGRFRNGTARLALRSACPVVPVGFSYTQIFTGNSRRSAASVTEAANTPGVKANPGLVVRIGPAMNFAEERSQWLSLPADSSGRATIERLISHKLRNEIAKLSGIAPEADPAVLRPAKAERPGTPVSTRSIQTRAVGALQQTETVDHGREDSVSRSEIATAKAKRSVAARKGGQYVRT